MSDIFKPEDLLIESYPPQPTGGMHVTRSPDGVKITHRKSRVFVVSDIVGVQMYHNKMLALAALEAIVTHPKFPKEFV